MTSAPPAVERWSPLLRRGALGLALLLLVMFTVWQWLSSDETAGSIAREPTPQAVPAAPVDSSLSSEPFSKNGSQTGTSPPARRPELNLARVEPAEFGAEGYAPFISRALESGSPEEAHKATGLIDRCKNIEGQLESAYRFRTENARFAASPASERIIKDFQQQQRYCQTVTPEVLALRHALLLKAAHGRVLGAPAQYLSSVQHHEAIDPPLRDFLREAIRDDAKKGDLGAIMMAATKYTQLGMPEIEARSYQAAYRQIAKAHPELGMGPIAELTVSMLEKHAPSMSPEEERKSKAIAQEIVVAYERRTEQEK